MKIERLKIPKAYLVTPDVYEDERGYFKETCNQFMDFAPVQSNTSFSKKGVIRGLHAQTSTAKLVWVVRGSIFDVVFDSETGKWEGIELSATNHKQLLIPGGKYHGFQALEDDTVVCYMMSMYYDPSYEHALNPEIIDWPLEEQIISGKDRNADKFLG